MSVWKYAPSESLLFLSSVMTHIASLPTQFHLNNNKNNKLQNKEEKIQFPVFFLLIPSQALTRGC